MKRIAELASVHEQLGVSRQTFFVTFGGWDHHEDTLGQQATMLPALDAGKYELVVGELHLNLLVQSTSEVKTKQEEPKILLLLLPKEVF